jgi:hypothetical protein
MNHNEGSPPKNTVPFVIPLSRVIGLISAGSGTMIQLVPVLIARSFLSECSLWQRDIKSGHSKPANLTSRQFSRCLPGDDRRPVYRMNMRQPQSHFRAESGLPLSYCDPATLCEKPVALEIILRNGVAS